MSKMSSLKATDIINSAASLWSQTPPAARKAFGIFLLLKFLLYSNRKLSQWSLNNWKSAAKFRPEKEIVLITGGSGGIGKQIVQDLAVKARGVTIVILDIQEPGFELREYSFPCISNSCVLTERKSPKHPLLQNRHHIAPSPQTIGF